MRISRFGFMICLSFKSLLNRYQEISGDSNNSKAVKASVAVAPSVLTFSGRSISLSRKDEQAADCQEAEKIFIGRSDAVDAERHNGCRFP